MSIMNTPRSGETASTRFHSIGPWFKSRGLLLFGIVVFSTLAFSQYRDAILLLGCDAREIDFGGGRGGGPVPDARCDGGFVAVGFHVRTGEFFNEAWLDCAPMRSDGSLGQERRVTSGTGTRGGRDVHDAPCPPGRVLRGLTGRTAASIDEAIGVCGPIRGQDDRRDDDRVRDDRRRDDDRPRDRDRRDDDRWDRNRGELTVPVTIPHPGGRPAEAVCPPNSVLVGFRTRGGEWIDHLSILCSEIQRTY
jgi:hypothetical protein